MTGLEIILLGVFTLYALTSLLLLLGTQRRPLSNTSRIADHTVSVLVAARNEEKYLPACLEALTRSDFPQEKFEILVIDDRSTDRTLPIAEMFAQRHSNVRVVPLTHRLSGMSGKASALCQGLAHATGDLILITDADCIVPPSWISAMAQHFTPDTGLVGGFTLLTPLRGQTRAPSPSHDNLFAKIQTLDWMYLLTAGAGAAGWGKPVSILGNNFGFRRAAYDHVGGYEAIGFTIVEDFALMQKIVRDTKWRVRFPLDPTAAIYSFPPATWRDFFHQRQRWAAGGKEMGWLAKFLMILAFCALAAIVLAGFISWKLLLVGLAAKLFMDALLLWRCAAALRCKPLLRYFLFFEFYFFIYSFMFAPTILLPATVHWKGVHYRWNMRGKIKSVEEKQASPAQ